MPKEHPDSFFFFKVINAPLQLGEFSIFLLLWQLWIFITLLSDKQFIESNSSFSEIMPIICLFGHQLLLHSYSLVEAQSGK